MDEISVQDAPNHAIIPSATVSNFFNPEPRTPSRSPRRPERKPVSDAENIYRDLSPSKTLRAIVASSGPTSDIPHDEETLIKSIENATESEKAFGVKVAEGSKLAKEWCAELEAWPWHGDFSPPISNEEVSAVNAAGGKPGYFEARLTSNDKEHKTADEEFWGSVSSRNVKRFEERLQHIKTHLIELDLEGQKKHVLDSHHRKSGSANEELPEFPTEAEYKQLDGLTALITVTVLQALPVYSRLSSLISVWAARLAVLRQVPGLFREIAATRQALDKAWYSLKAGPAIAFNASVISGDNESLGPDSYHGIGDHLREKIATIGRRIDVMLDALEGQEETLPEHWVDMVEKLEKDFVEWTHDMHAKLSRDQSRAEAIDSDSGTPNVHEDESSLPTDNQLIPDSLEEQESKAKDRESEGQNNLSSQVFSGSAEMPEMPVLDPKQSQTTRDAEPLVPNENVERDSLLDSLQKKGKLETTILPTQNIETRDEVKQSSIMSDAQTDMFQPDTVGFASDTGLSLTKNDKDEDRISNFVREDSNNMISQTSQETEKQDSAPSEQFTANEMYQTRRLENDSFFLSEDSRTPTTAAFTQADVNEAPSDQSVGPLRSNHMQLPQRGHRPQDSVAFSEISVYHSAGTRDSMDSSGSLFFTPDASKRASIASSGTRDSFDGSLSFASSPRHRNSATSSTFSRPFDIPESDLAECPPVSPRISWGSSVASPATLPKSSAIPRRRKIPVLANRVEVGVENEYSPVSASERPTTSSSGKASEASMDKLDREIDQILTTLPAPVVFAKDSTSRQQSTPRSQTFSSRRSVSPGLHREATPDLTLAPAPHKDARGGRDGANDIRLYYLTPSGRDPIKLYVRLVGGYEERVMVRVGGGWVDLADYLNEYVLHHRRTATFSELPTRPEPNTRIPSAPVDLRKKPSFTLGGQYASNLPLPRLSQTPKTPSASRNVSLSSNSVGRRSITPNVPRPGTSGSETGTMLRSPTPLSQKLRDDISNPPAATSRSSGHSDSLVLGEVNNVNAETPGSLDVKPGTRIPRLSSGAGFRELGTVGNTRRIYRVSDVGTGN